MPQDNAMLDKVEEGGSIRESAGAEQLAARKSAKKELAEALKMTKDLIKSGGTGPTVAELKAKEEDTSPIFEEGEDAPVEVAETEEEPAELDLLDAGVAGEVEDDPVDAAAKPKVLTASEKLQAKANSTKKARRQQKILEEKEREVRSLQERTARAEALEQRLKTDPFGALAESGVDLTKVIPDFLNKKGTSTVDPKVDPIAAVYEKRLADMEKKIEDQKKEIKREKDEATIGNFKAKIASEISDRKAFALVHLKGGAQHVYDQITETWNKALKNGYTEAELRALEAKGQFEPKRVAAKLEQHYRAISGYVSNPKKSSSETTPAKKAARSAPAKRTRRQAEETDTEEVQLPRQATQHPLLDRAETKRIEKEDMAHALALVKQQMKKGN